MVTLNPVTAQDQTAVEPVFDLDYKCTDLGNAERLAHKFGSIIRFSFERNHWLYWTGRHWAPNMNGHIESLGAMVIRSIYGEAADTLDTKRREDLAKHAVSSESAHRINSMLRLARSQPGIPIMVSQLDADPWLFNCLNGTIDLRKGDLLTHRPQDYLTVVVPVEYHPDAQCPLWLKFLERVTGGDAELTGYLQRAVGYSLTGDTKMQLLFFLFGLGNNGKSTFLATVRKLVGNYGERVNTDVLMIKDKNAGGPKEALANLRGKRFAVASELEGGRRMAVGLVKDMTGGETIKADRKYEHEVEYQPTHKLWLVGNHKPVIADSTLSIWRRVKLIPFTVTIPDTEVDADLPLKLEAELPGILAWAVRGCLNWQRDGLLEPKTVTTATASYRHDSDILGDFLEDCCILEPMVSMPKADLKEQYTSWCQDNGVETVSQKTFKGSLMEKGVGEGRIGKARLWRGIRLKTPEDTVETEGDK